MSAPDTKIATQKRRHRGPLIGIAVALLFGAAMMAYWSAKPDVETDATQVPAEAAPPAATIPDPAALSAPAATQPPAPKP